LQKVDSRKTVANMGFSAMLAEEYKLMDISLLSFSPGRMNKAQQQNIKSTALTLLSSSLG